MTDKSVPTLPSGILTPEQVEAISGGECTPQQIIDILGQLKSSYDTLVDFTSHVIERVAR